VFVSRGDAGSTDNMRSSLRLVGLNPDLGGIPFLVMSEDISEMDCYDAAHYATRSDSLKIEYEREMVKPESERLPTIMISVSNGFPRANIYRRDSPPWLTIFLVAYGNSCNGVATITSVLEKWVGTTATEHAFEQQCRLMRWVRSQWSSKVHDEKKSDVVGKLRKNWWSSYYFYENCASFYAVRAAGNTT
jgi:hypothetical protein